jgi:hypothetical protein
MLSKIVITGALLATLGSFRPSEVADSVGWKTLRSAAVTAVSIQR